MVVEQFDITTEIQEIPDIGIVIEIIDWMSVATTITR